LLLAGGCQSPDAGTRASILEIEEAPIDLSETIASYDLTTPAFSPGASDSTPPSRPTGAYLEGQALVFADPMSTRFYRLQLDDSTLTSFGREGAGPGELLAPSSISVLNGAYYVLDGRNARVSRYSHRGEFLDMTALGTGASRFTVLDDQTVVVPAPNQDDIVQFLGPNGDRRLSDPWPSDPWPTDPSIANDVAREFRSAMALVARASGNSVHVVDATRGVLVRVSREGRLLAVRYLPAEFLQAVRDESDARAARFPAPPLFTALASTLSVGPDGMLFLGTRTSTALGLVIDPDTYRARTVKRPDDVPEPILEVLFQRDRAYLLTDSRVLVRRWSTS
jgi:hypothetical protein